MSRRVVLPGLVTVAGVVLVVGLAVAAARLSGRDGQQVSSGGSVNDLTPGAGTTIASPRTELNLAVYLDLWERSRVGTYVAIGEERRWSVDNGIETTSGIAGYHHARQGDRSLVVFGSSLSLTTNETTQVCNLLDADVPGRPPELLCDQGQPMTTVDEERRGLEAELLGRYRLFAGVDPDCVELIGDGPVVFGRFGQSTIACFDPATGALVREATFSGRRRRELIVTDVSPKPDQSAFDPLAVVPDVAAVGRDG